MLRGVEVAWDREKPEAAWESALVLRDVDGLTLEGFKGEPGRSGVAALVQERVR